MLKYGSDKPDLRNPLRIVDLSELFAGSSFRAFAGKIVRAIRLPQTSGNTRSFWDRLEEQAKTAGAAGLAWLTVEADGSLKGPVAKFLTPESAAQLIAQTESVTGDAIIILADTDKARSPESSAVSAIPWDANSTDRRERLPILLDRRFPDV